MGAPTPTEAKIAAMHLVNPSQREQIEAEIRTAESGLNRRSMYTAEDRDQVDMRDVHTSDPRFPSADPAILRESIARDRETLRRGLPPDYSGYQKNQIWEMVQAAQKKIQEGMPTQEQMEMPTYANVQHFIQHEEYTSTAQQVYMNGLRILDQASESIAVEGLRPSKASALNIKAWELGHSKITWTPEEQLADELSRLDDSVYLAVLQLQLGGIKTPKLLQAKLGISQATYEACMVRLAESTAGVAPDHEARSASTSAKSNGKVVDPANDAAKVRTYLEKHGARPVNSMALHLKMSRARIEAALMMVETMTADSAA